MDGMDPWDPFGMPPIDGESMENPSQKNIGEKRGIPIFGKIVEKWTWIFAVGDWG